MFRSRWIRWLLIAIALLLIVPILECAAVRWINPPLTPLMLLRSMESRGHSTPNHQYHWLPLANMPRSFVTALLVAEDQRFFEHHGFDWKEVEHARADAKRKHKAPRGASTISMQCARSLFLWQGRSWVRKGLEAYYTFWMEKLLSKRRILELYANVIEMGDGVYGVEAAAQSHYHRPAANLSLDQSTMLASILPNPRKWNPNAPDAKLQQRHAKVLKGTREAMAGEGAKLGWHW